MIRAFLAIEMPETLRSGLALVQGELKAQPRRRALGGGGQHSPDLEIFRQRAG